MLVVVLRIQLFVIPAGVVDYELPFLIRKNAYTLVQYDYKGDYECVRQITHLLFLVRRKPVSTLHSKPKRWQREQFSPTAILSSDASKLHRSY